MVLLRSFATLFLIFSVINICEKIIPSREPVFIFAASLSTTYFLASSPFNFHDKFDVIAFLLICLTCLSKNLAVIFTCFILAFFTDERSVLSSFLIPFFWHINNQDTKTPLLKNINFKKTAVLILALISYFSIRLTLTKTTTLGIEFNLMSQDDLGFVLMAKAINYYWHGVFTLSLIHI